jgi:hypothetical protein
LVATGESSLLNDWRLRRAKFGLWDLYGIETPPGRDAANRPMRREVGKGRVAYLPRLEPAAPPPPAQMTYHVTNEHFRLPKNWKDLVDAVEWAAKGEYSVQVDAPLWVTMELAEQKGTGARLLHLLNFKVNEPVTNVAVRMRIPQGKELGEVVVRTPDEGPAQEVKPTVRDGVASFTVPRLNVYDLVLLRMRAAR